MRGGEALLLVELCWQKGAENTSSCLVVSRTQWDSIYHASVGKKMCDRISFAYRRIVFCF